MIRRRDILAGAGALAAWPALAQAALPRVTLVTALGALEFELAVDKAPITANNFLAYVDQKRLDGSSFYRAMKLRAAPPFGLIQGGLQGNPAKVLPAIAHEPTTKTGLKHLDGTISLARYAPGPRPATSSCASAISPRWTPIPVRLATTRVSRPSAA